MFWCGYFFLKARFMDNPTHQVPEPNPRVFIFTKQSKIHIYKILVVCRAPLRGPWLSKGNQRKWWRTLFDRFFTGPMWHMSDTTTPRQKKKRSDLVRLLHQYIVKTFAPVYTWHEAQKEIFFVFLGTWEMIVLRKTPKFDEKFQGKKQENNVKKLQVWLSVVCELGCLRWVLVFRLCSKQMPASKQNTSKLLVPVTDIVWLDFTLCNGNKLVYAHSHTNMAERRHPIESKIKQFVKNFNTLQDPREVHSQVIL